MQSSPVLSDQDRTLRRIIAIAWIPAFVFLLVDGISSGEVVPALAIVPMTLSVATSVLQLSNKQFSTSTFAVVADIFIAAFLIGVLIPGWIFLSENWSSRDNGDVMVGTYGTVPCMLNFCVHSFFFLRWLVSSYNSGFKKSCPHCHGALSVSRFWSHSAPVSLNYDSLDGDEGFEHSDKDSVKISMIDKHEKAGVSKDPRPSTDDESAALV